MKGKRLPIKETIMSELARLEMPDGSSPVSADMIRALTIEGTTVHFVIEAASAGWQDHTAPGAWHHDDIARDDAR